MQRLVAFPSPERTISKGGGVKEPPTIGLVTAALTIGGKAMKFLCV